MAEFRKVQIHPDGRVKSGKETPTSTYYFNNLRYFLQGSRPLSVPLEVANAWIAADSNVAILPER